MKLLELKCFRFKRARSLIVLAVLVLMLTTAIAIFWQQSTLKQYAPRFVWTCLLISVLVYIAFMHGRRGIALALACAAIISPLGFIPWVGLGALVVLALGVPIALIGSMLLCFKRTQSVAHSIVSSAICVLLCGLLVLLPSVGCGPLQTLSGTTSVEQLAQIARSDQEDRRSACFVFNPQRDVMRRSLVRAVINKAEVLPAGALVDAGLVLLHSTDMDDLELAHSVLLEANEMGHKQATALQRVVVDRLRLGRGEAQVYSTQWLYSR